LRPSRLEDPRHGLKVWPPIKVSGVLFFWSRPVLFSAQKGQIHGKKTAIVLDLEGSKIDVSVQWVLKSLLFLV